MWNVSGCRLSECYYRMYPFVEVVLFLSGTVSGRAINYVLIGGYLQGLCPVGFLYCFNGDFMYYNR